MNDLEKLTKALLEKYGKDKFKQDVNWTKLNAERKKAWAEEVLFIVNYIITELEKVPGSEQTIQENTSFAMGLKAGIHRERLEWKSKLENIKATLKDDLEEFD